MGAGQPRHPGPVSGRPRSCNAPATSGSPTVPPTGRKHIHHSWLADTARPHGFCSGIGSMPLRTGLAGLHPARETEW